MSMSLILFSLILAADGSMPMDAGDAPDGPVAADAPVLPVPLAAPMAIAGVTTS